MGLHHQADGGATSWDSKDLGEVVRGVNEKMNNA